MSFIQKEATIIVSSDPALGASNCSIDGSSFEVQLEDSLEIPKNAINCSICVESATVWWTCPNVITGQNDKLYIYGDSNTLVPVPQLYTITIPQGLYDLTGLNTSILSQLQNLGARSDPPLVNLSADSNTQKVNVKFNYSNVYIDFTQANTFREILGFNPQVYGPYITAPVNVLADNTAGFNTINYFLIGSDLVRRGIQFNNKFAGVISQVLIDVSPGSQIVSTPFNPSKIECDELIGAKRSNIRFRLTDDKLRPVNTNGEFYSARIVIRYQIKM